MSADKIILGLGTFYIGAAAIAVTRGGGQFIVERTFRDISADGDRGSVKGRVTIDESRAKLKMNLLEIVGSNLASMYPGTKFTVDTGKFEEKAQIDETDYKTVKWVGKTKDGKAVTIELLNAINKENIDWSMQDKNEIVAALTYEACYDDNNEEFVAPWSVIFAS